jgi:tetratricopeptide (TPR) repeat protein
VAQLAAPAPAPELPDAVGQAPTASTMVSQGLRLLSANHNADAVIVLRQAVQRYPNSAEAHHTLGVALAKVGSSEEAIRELETAQTINPSLSSTWLTLAGLHQSLGHMDQAIALYRAFLANFKNRPDLKETLATVGTLVTGLDKERSEANTYADGTQVLQKGLLQAPAQASVQAPDNDDYLQEMERPPVGLPTWPKARMPIKVLIHLGDSVPGYKKQWKDILVRSFEDWSQASRGLVRFQIFTDPKKAADAPGDVLLDCSFSDDERHSHGGFANDAEAGEAKMYLDPDGLRKGSITILTKSLSSILPLTDNRIRLICLHEIGHALGLAGHTHNPDDIMFYSTTFKDEWRELSGRDARTIQRLYSPH